VVLVLVFTIVDRNHHNVKDKHHQVVVVLVHLVVEDEAERAEQASV
jgi:hypothetical protein